MSQRSRSDRSRPDAENDKRRETFSIAVTLGKCSFLIPLCIAIYYLDPVTLLTKSTTSLQKDHNQSSIKSGTLWHNVRLVIRGPFVKDAFALCPFRRLIVEFCWAYFLFLVLVIILGSLALAWEKTRIFLTETSLATGHKRVRWKCSCGKNLYDDYIEIKPGSITDLTIQILDRYQNKTQIQKDRMGSSSLILLINGLMSLIFSNPFSAISAQVQRWSSSHTREHKSTSIDVEARTDQKSEIVDLHLLIMRGGFMSKLYPLDVSTVSSDYDLFSQMRAVRDAARSRWYHRFSLRSVRAIRLVQFALYRNKNVGVRAVPPDPNCVPPLAKLEELKYRYSSAIDGWFPPVGENELVHLYENLHDTEPSCTAILPLLPKKVLEHLTLSDGQGRAIGWGLHFVEGWNGKRALLVLWMLFISASLSFAISWSALRHDIQGAFGVATYIAGFLALAVGTMQVLAKS